MSAEQLRHYQVGKQDKHAARYYRIRRCLAHGDGAAFYRIAEECRYAGDDESEDDGFDDAAPYVPFHEHVLQPVFQVYGIHHVSEPAGAEGTYDACKNAEHHQDGNHGHHSRDFGQDEVVGRVDAHDFQRVNLLGHPHGSQFGGDVRAYLARQYKTHDGRGELQQHDFARHVAYCPSRHPRAFDVQFDLYGNYGTDEE